MPLALASALASVALGLLLAAPGCLNPRPEEDPSIDSTEGIEPGNEDNPSAPVRESCDDNPYLAGCEAPDQDSVAEPAPAAGGATPGAPAPADSSGADAPDAGAGDAGLPADATDAQAP